MSDWEIVEPNKKSIEPEGSEWEIISQKQQAPKESLLDAVMRAPFRVGEDVYTAGANFARNIPQYYQQAKTEVPGIFQTVKEHPGHLAMQGLAGANEAINKFAQMPLGLAQYGAERLNLLPEGVPNAISKITPQDTSGAINQLFGEPKYPGEAMARGSFRNIPELFATKGIASKINPARYFPKNVANQILKEGEVQISAHNKLYNDLWKDAEKAGINKIHYDPSLLETNYKVLDKFYPEKSSLSLKALIEEPTLEHAQAAQSDLGALRRSLEEKARTTPLLESEKALHKMFLETEKHIEDRMFRDLEGNINKPLADRYRAISKSYRENVVPYRYNPDIQAYKNKELLAKEMLGRVKGGEFGAKKGAKHPDIYRSEALQKAIIPLLSGAGGAGGAYLMYKYLTGKPD